MRLLLFAAIIFMGIFVSNASAVDFRGTCEISFDVAATLKKFQGTAQCEPFRVEKNDDLFQIPVIAVQVANMNTGNSLRDRDMRRMFDRENHPLIFGMPGTDDLVDISKWTARRPEEINGVTFQLRIRDRVHPVSARMTDLAVSEEKISARLHFNVSLALFELNPPSFLGLVRLNDEVKVTTDIRLKLIQ